MKILHMAVLIGMGSIACSGKTDDVPDGAAATVITDAGAGDSSTADATPENDASTKLTIEAACAKMHGTGDWTQESYGRSCTYDGGKEIMMTMGENAADCRKVARCAAYLMRPQAIETIATCFANFSCTVNLHDQTICGRNLDAAYVANAAAADTYLAAAKKKREACPNINASYTDRVDGTYWNALNDDVLAALTTCLKKDCSSVEKCFKGVFEEFAGTRDATCAKGGSNPPQGDAGGPFIVDGGSGGF